MSSTVVCGYTGASWEVNSAGQDACVQYAHLVGTCQSTFTVAPVTPASPPYLPVAGNAACSCNVVAYNLAAACGWCQDAIQPTWWATEAQWSGNCTQLTAVYNPTGLPATVPTASLTIPAWALATVDPLVDTWSPSEASLLASPNPTATGTDLGFTTAFPTTYGYTYPGTTYNPYTYDPYGYYGAVYTASAGAVAIGVGVAVGLWALHFIIIGVVFWMRQKRRKAWYGPTAAYYASGGVGPGAGLAAAPLLYHNEPNMQGSPRLSTTHASHSPAPSGAYTPYQPPPPVPGGPQGFGGPPPGSTPYTPYNDPRQSYMPPPGSAAGYSTHSGGTGYMGAGGGGSGDAHAYPPNTPGTNPFTTPYPTPGQGQGPPPGAAAAPGGYTGHAEVY